MKEPTLNATDIALLEQPVCNRLLSKPDIQADPGMCQLVKVPVDQLRRNLRTTQRYIERDFQYCQNAVAELSKASSSSSSTEGLKSIDNMLSRMRGLKRKVLQI